jgi:hypothetical protein
MRRRISTTTRRVLSILLWPLSQMGKKGSGAPSLRNTGLEPLSFFQSESGFEWKQGQSSSHPSLLLFRRFRYSSHPIDGSLRPGQANSNLRTTSRRVAASGRRAAARALPFLCAGTTSSHRGSRVPRAPRGSSRLGNVDEACIFCSEERRGSSFRSESRGHGLCASPPGSRRGFFWGAGEAALVTPDRVMGAA